MEVDARSKARNSYVEELTNMIAAATASRNTIKGSVDAANTDLMDMSAKLAHYYNYEKQRQAATEEKDRIDKQLQVISNSQQQKLDGKVSWARAGRSCRRRRRSRS